MYVGFRIMEKYGSFLVVSWLCSLTEDDIAIS
jgi:hypothetical protein